MTVEKDKPRDADYWNHWVAQEQPFEDSRRWIDPKDLFRAQDNFDKLSPEEKARWDALYGRIKELSEKYPTVMYASTPSYRDEFEHRSYYDRIREHSLIITTPQGKSEMGNLFLHLSEKTRQRGDPEKWAFVWLDALDKKDAFVDIEVQDKQIAVVLGDRVGDLQVQYQAEGGKSEKKTKARKPLPYYHNTKKPWKTR